ncbi:tetratricopeptide repeat protein [Streptomyces sp. NPDC101776]|uniref:tetratricopeptide repeat protein n=1 Tax=Streptomyces sp. NPDC101776 TaxID=3366146 RepID=UPI0037FB9E45
MDQVTAVELRAALTSAARRPEERWSLARLVRPVPSAALDAAVRDWLGGGSRVGEDVAGLAELLAQEAASRPWLAEELLLWRARIATDPEPVSGGGATNTVGTSARITGPVVQARDVTGGIHFHPAPEPAVVVPPTVPRQLPPVPGHFINRQDELAALDRLLSSHRDSPVIAVISGPAGVGKTTLARRWLLGRAESFPDGQLYVDLRGHSPDGPARPGELLTELLRSFGHERIPAELNEQAALWRSVTADARIALLLDNVFSAAQVRPLLPGSRSALTAVTSRNRLTMLGLDGAAFLQLGVLGTTDAVELLARRVGADRVRREPEAALAMVEACAGLPLAVCVAGARLAARPRQPLAVMARALNGGEEGALNALRVGGESAVRAALQESYRLLVPELAAGYRRLSVLPVPVITPPVVAAVCQVSLDEADRLLDELAEVNLLEDLGPDQRTGLGRYRFHDLLRAHARERAAAEESVEGVERAVRSVVDFYLSAATAAEGLLTPSHLTLRRDYARPPGPPPFAGATGALCWLDAERAALMGVLRAAAERGWHAAAWQLADALWPLAIRLRPYDLWIEAHEIGLMAARRDGDRDGISRMLTSGGVGLYSVGRYEEAASWFQQALDAAEEGVARFTARGEEEGLAAARRGAGQALHGLGQTSRLAGRLTEARAYFGRALALREDIGHRRGAALTRLALGDTALAAGRFDEALPHLVEAREGLLAERDVHDAARALAYLGRAHALRDGVRHEHAERQLLDALGEFEAIGSVPWQARVLELLGQGAEERGDTERARDWYEQSLARYGPVNRSDRQRLEERLRTLP